MAWQLEMVRILRYLIDDVDATTYDNSRLEETLLVGAQLILNEISFDNTYTIDVDSLTLSPDPTTLATKDNAFINLTSLRSAIIVVAGELKASSAYSISVQDGPSSINFGQLFKNKKEMLALLQEQFSNAKLAYLAGNSIAGQVVMTPTTYENYYAGFFPN